MPDLIFRRGDDSHVKNVCMYCGRPATHRCTKRITNPRLDPISHSRSDFSVPTGNDPISGCIALVVLPLMLLELGKNLCDDARHNYAKRNAPPLDPPHTDITITACDRHQRFGWRFLRLAIGMFVLFVASWVAVVLLRHQPGGAPLWLFAVCIVTTLVFPIVFTMLWNSDGPVRVSWIGRDEVKLTRVRQAYFDAPE